ncbi:MAG: IS3 family transposase [Gammaproteobacteria bacterium]
MIRLIDEQYLRTPFYDRRRMTAYFNDLDQEINRKRIQRLM